MKNITRRVLEKIKKDEIKPKPRWSFVMKNYSLWVLFGISIIVGSIAASLILFILRNNEWDLHPVLGTGLSKFILLTFPYFWLIILAVFIYLTYIEIKRTKTGYKYNPLLIVLISFLVSITLGSGVYATGLGERMEKVLNRSPLYQRMFFQKQRMWEMPGSGLIGGTITKIDSEYDFEIEDLKGNIFHIIADEESPTGNLILQEGMEVKIIGEKIDEETFKAYEVRPFFGPRKEIIREEHKNFIKGERKFSPPRISK